MNTVPNLISQNGLIEYMFYEKIFKVNQNDCTTELIKSINSNCLEQMSSGFNIQNTNLYDFKDLLKFEDELGTLAIRFRKRGQLDLANILIQVADCLLKRKQQIDCLLQGNQNTNDISNIDFASLDQLLNQSIDFCQSLTSGTIKSQVQDLNQQFSSLILNQQLICDRYRAFVVCQHLVSFNCSEGTKRQLFQKLNDIIHPIWNQLKEEQEVFFQKIFARIIVQDLQTALTNAGKLKQAEAVQSLILTGIGKLSKTKNYSGLHLFIEEETGDDKKNEFDFLSQEQIQYNTEVRGCEFIVQEWINENNYGILNIQKIQKLITQFDPNDSEDKFQVFVSVLFKIIQNLFLSRAQSKSRQKNQKNDSIQNLNLILNSIQRKQDFFKIRSIKFVPDLIVNLFYLLSLEIKIEDSERDNNFTIQIELISIIVSNLEGQSLSAFKVLQYLLEQCLSQKQRQIASEDKHTDEMILQKNMGELSQDILKYLALFLIPVIRSLQHSKAIFNGEEKQGMKILSLIIQLLPLCSINQNPNDLLASKVGLKLQEGKEFLKVFTQINIESADFQIHVLPNSELRNYQKQGIIWMSKLGRMGLNCALCDDMGLGKTIQSLTVVLSESYLFRKDEKNNQRRALNLVICPNTLTYQWYKEIDKFFGQYYINSAILDTSSSQVQSVFKRIQQNDLDILITSYEKARNDFEMLQQFSFFYIVLDEGHRIKNAKSKTALCIKTLQAERKLILTGTPLQNKVSELWSIFDFLMPNFLEVEKVFNQKYNQFLSSNLNKLSEKLEDTQTFIQALKSLKKRITPFILRRTKQEVLKDLPPKQIQDFDCQMTPSQQKIHNYIEQNYPIQQVTQGTNLDDLQNYKEDGIQQEDATKSMKGSQILQNLILHRKVCNHPSLVIDQIPKDLKNTLKYENNQFINDSGKLLGLIDLLKECQIISNDLFDNDDKSEEALKEKGSRQKKNGNIVEDQAKFQGFLHLADDNDSDDLEQLQRPTQISIEQIEGHRAIIFCQMQSYLQIVIDRILTPFGIKFAQMHASLTGQQRFELVEKFNTDTTISVIIMTTSVGGLGLNLTGADTVIFMEHDWNPMKDLQAIDRAHRIGQKRRVNVYRLILRDTLEQKIMSLQSFKKNLAKNLIQSRRADFSIQDAENLQMHDLLSCFEEHTVYNETTANQIEKNNKDPNVIGAESYQDKVGKDDGLEPEFE